MIAAALGLALAAAPAAPPCPAVALVSALQKIRDHEPWCDAAAAAAASDSVALVKIAAAQNEYESVQVRLPSLPASTSL